MKGVSAAHGRTLVRAHFPDLVLLGAAAGFLLLTAELVLTEHSDGLQAVAILAGITGALLCLGGLLVRQRWARLLAAAALVLLSAVGPLGVFLHLGGEVEAAAVERTAPAGLSVYNDEDDEGEKEEEEDEEGVPPLAPLSLSGLALLGASAIMARGEDEA